ncbi:MAG: FAD-binding oxidoreductase, partial [Cytophagales bacterium]|nr:FAD-binding oxidoreductase [Cytophagales bacterium]
MNSLIAELENKLGSKKIAYRLIDKLAYASDAGFYRLVPEVIVRPEDEVDIISLFSISKSFKTPLTFRAAGTSLSGQSISQGILVDLSKGWKKVVPSQENNSVLVQPGVTGGIVNQILRKKSCKIGPDPSSIHAAMMGGILANNSSGMCCGVKHNSYHTLKSIKIILPNGYSYNTLDKSDYSRFEQEQPELFNGLNTLRTQIQNNGALVSKIRQKYEIKNTVGYCINSFLDYEHPLDIFSHLMIGSEGTLGFIAQAELYTLPDYPFKATAFLFFPTISAACAAISPLIDAGAEALELMDRSSLRTIEDLAGVPPIIRTLPSTGAALLCEMQSDTLESLQKKIQKAEQALHSMSLIAQTSFSQDPDTQYLYWKLRKGMFPAVGAVRQKGTTVVLEDIAFPIHQLAPAIENLQELFLKYNYSEAIIFGHAKDGNIHFVITQDFNSDSEIKRYDNFLQEVVELTVKKYQGSLKAEHGTGRNMAPFVETEWGPEAYGIMKTVKRLADPFNLLNPGVIINDDPKAHLKNLKPMPVVESQVDKCIECGYCEPNCPSRNLTITPRQRIQLRREMVQMDKGSDAFLELQKDYQYAGLDTCAVDGMCANDCPVDINTGELVKRLRKESHHTLANRVALWIAHNFGFTVHSIRLLLKIGVLTNKYIHNDTMVNLTKGIRKIVPNFPLWINGTTVPSLVTHSPSSPDFIYFQTCISRLMGGNNGKKGLAETLLEISDKVGIRMALSTSIEGSCCSQAFSSKGYEEAAKKMALNTVQKLFELSQNGQIPIVSDTSSCSQTLQSLSHYLEKDQLENYKKLKIIKIVLYVFH